MWILNNLVKKLAELIDNINCKEVFELAYTFASSANRLILL